MIFLTGGTGLTGSHLLLQLTSMGENVRALKRKDSSLLWVENIFSWYRPEDYDSLLKRIEWVDGDVNDIVSLGEAINGIKQVYHCAALVSYAPSDKEIMFKINIEGTANIVNAALFEGVEKICHCSSISAIGKTAGNEVVNESCVWKTSPHNANYAISKFGAEREIWRGLQEGLDVVIVNPSVIIGSGDMSRSSGQFFNTVLKGMRFYSDGSTGFVDVRDVADVMIKLMDSNISGERYILNSENLQYKELFDKMSESLGVKSPMIKAGKFLCELGWRLEYIMSKITGKKPIITKETARAANDKTIYSNKKIISTLDYEFISVDKAILNTVGFINKYYDR